jgi:peptidyl-prolyl cis-trans isomerase C
MAQISFRAALLAGAIALASATGAAPWGPAFAQDTNTQDTNSQGTTTAAPATGDSAAPADAAPAAADQSGTPQPTVPGAAAPTPADPAEVVAKINGKDITRQDVINSAADLPPQYMAQIDRIFPQLLNRMIGLQLLVSKGREQGLADSAEVKRFVKQAEDQAISQAYLQQLVQKDVTEDAIKAIYDADLKEHPPQIEIRASHILVKTEDEAKAIIKQIQDGGDFAKLAEEKSIDTESAKKGGDLDWFTKDTMVKEFSDAAFAMQRGDISKVPVKTQFGWHIIKITDSRMQTPAPLEQRRDDIRKALSQEAVHKEVQDLIGKAQVEYTKDEYKLPLAPSGQ